MKASLNLKAWKASILVGQASEGLIFSVVRDPSHGVYDNYTSSYRSGRERLSAIHSVEE